VDRLVVGTETECGHDRQQPKDAYDVLLASHKGAKEKIAVSVDAVTTHPKRFTYKTWLNSFFFLSFGKKAVENHHRQAPFHLLKDVPSLSVGDPGSGQTLH